MADEQFDLERNDGSPFLMNHTVQSFLWKDLTVSVKDRKTGKPLNLISEISGQVQQGTQNQHPKKVPLMLSLL